LLFAIGVDGDWFFNGVVRVRAHGGNALFAVLNRCPGAKIEDAAGGVAAATLTLLAAGPSSVNHRSGLIVRFTS